MFQSITYIRALGYNATTKLHEHEYELVDSDFSCVEVARAGAARVVIQEYSKRKLNVAANLVKYFRFQENRYGWTIAQQIAWLEDQPLFTPKIKADIQKYLTPL